MNSETPLPDDVRRFVFTTVPSVPHVEAVLLLRRESSASWTPGQLARRIYLPETRASGLLQELEAAGITEKMPEGEAGYRYRPSPELAGMLDRLAALYSTNLVAVTDLIHSSLDRRAHQFADAFRWKKD